MTIFSHLTKLRTFETTHLPMLMTREDSDIMRVVGLYQEQMKPLLLKQLFLENIGSFSTVNRRLTRLRDAGYVQAASPGLDRRSILLELSPKLQKVYVRYGLLLQSLGSA